MGTNDRSPAQADNDEKQRAAAQKQRLIDYKLTFTSQHGERVLRDLKAQFLYGKPAFHSGISTEHGILIAGGQHVLSHIEEMIEADPSGRAES
jgi:hypothetical protein